jgi:hypothetical protein
MSGFEDWLISVFTISLRFFFLFLSRFLFVEGVSAHVSQGLALHIFSMLLLSCC